MHLRLARQRVFLCFVCLQNIRCTPHMKELPMMWMRPHEPARAREREKEKWLDAAKQYTVIIYRYVHFMQSKVNSSPFRSGRNILFSSHIGVWWVLYALCTLYVCLWRLSQHDRLFRLLFASQVHTHKIHNARRRTHNKSK